MKEFHIMISEAHINRIWLSSLLLECELEPGKRPNDCYKVGKFLDRIFGLGFYGDSIMNLGKFVKSGKYKQQMELYK